MHVMLKPGWPGVFGRTIRDPAGDPTHRLEFMAGVAVELDGQELTSCADDIGKSLVIVRIDAKGHPRVDDLATLAFARGEPAGEKPATQAAEVSDESEPRSHRRQRR